jgi:crossover junction endodeoxyribonuclease RuvC
MRVLGIDPGTVRMGYGLLEETDHVRAVDWGVLTIRSSLPIEERLYQLYAQLLDLIIRCRPDSLAVEEPFVGKGERQFIGPALAVGQAQALVLIAAAGQAIPVKRYPPAQVKQAIANYGAASKEQVQEMVCTVLDLDSVPSPSDAADALAIALCHLRQAQVEQVLDREIRF